MALVRNEMHPDDDAALTVLRDQLRQARLDAKVSGASLCRKLGRNNLEFISCLENGKNRSPKMSSLQQWAGALDLRVEFGVDHFWLFTHLDTEMLSLYRQSRPWGADVAMRLWLVSALRAWRSRRGIDVEVLAPLLNTDVDSVRDWEFDASDPMMARAMCQARATGTVVTMRLYAKGEWIYG